MVAISTTSFTFKCPQLRPTIHLCLCIIPIQSKIISLQKINGLLASNELHVTCPVRPDSINIIQFKFRFHRIKHDYWAVSPSVKGLYKRAEFNAGLHKFSKKSRTHIKILGARRVTCSKHHTENQQFCSDLLALSGRCARSDAHFCT